MRREKSKPKEEEERDREGEKGREKERKRKGERRRERERERDASFVCVSVWYLKGPFVASLYVCTNELRLLRIQATWEVTIGCACYSDIPYFVPFSFTINTFASFPILFHSNVLF